MKVVHKDSALEKRAMIQNEMHAEARHPSLAFSDVRLAVCITIHLSPKFNVFIQLNCTHHYILVEHNYNHLMFYHNENLFLIHLNVPR